MVDERRSRPFLYRLPLPLPLLRSPVLCISGRRSRDRGGHDLETSQPGTSALDAKPMTPGLVASRQSILYLNRRSLHHDIHSRSWYLSLHTVPPSTTHNTARVLRGAPPPLLARCPPPSVPSYLHTWLALFLFATSPGRYLLSRTEPGTFCIRYLPAGPWLSSNQRDRFSDQAK